MNRAEITISFDPTNLEHSKAVRNLLSVVSGEKHESAKAVEQMVANLAKSIKEANTQDFPEGGETSRVEESVKVKPIPEEVQKVKTPRKPRKKAVKKETVEKKPESQYTLDNIREATAAKVKQFRTEIKEKINGWGYKTVSDIEESRYPEFIKFLEELS